MNLHGRDGFHVVRLISPRRPAQTDLIRDDVEIVPTTRGGATAGRDAFHRVRNFSFVPRFIIQFGTTWKSSLPHAAVLRLPGGPGIGSHPDMGREFH